MSFSSLQLNPVFATILSLITFLMINDNNVNRLPNVDTRSASGPINLVRILTWYETANSGRSEIANQIRKKVATVCETVKPHRRPVLSLKG